MKIYLICPVRNSEWDFSKTVQKLEQSGHIVHFPPRDVDQNDPIGLQICKAHRTAMENCDEVHVIWSADSTGSHFDLGMAFALRKPVHLIESLTPDTPGKSYLRVIQAIAQ